MQSLKKAKYLIILFVLISTVVVSQVDSVYYGVPAKKEKPREKEKPAFNFKEKLSFGGNFMIWFGQTNYVYLSPTVNLALTDRLNVGAGIVYNYYSDPFYNYSIYGVHTYAIAFVTKSLFAKAEFNHLLQPDYFATSLNSKIWVSYLFLGGGFRQPLGEHASMFTSVLFLVNETPQSFFYQNPQIQIGILAGF